MAAGLAAGFGACLAAGASVREKRPRARTAGRFAAAGGFGFRAALCVLDFLLEFFIGIPLQLTWIFEQFSKLFLFAW